MNLTLEVGSVNIIPECNSRVMVKLMGVSRSLLICQIIGDGIVNHEGQAATLDLIGKQAAMKYFNLKEND